MSAEKHWLMTINGLNTTTTSGVARWISNWKSSCLTFIVASSGDFKPTQKEGWTAASISMSGDFPKCTMRVTSPPVYFDHYPSLQQGHRCRCHAVNAGSDGGWTHLPLGGSHGWPGCRFMKITADPCCLESIGKRSWGARLQSQLYLGGYIKSLLTWNLRDPDVKWVNS